MYFNRVFTKQGWYYQLLFHKTSDGLVGYKTVIYVRSWIRQYDWKYSGKFFFFSLYSRERAAIVIIINRKIIAYIWPGKIKNAICAHNRLHDKTCYFQKNYSKIGSIYYNDFVVSILIACYFYNHTYTHTRITNTSEHINMFNG